MLNNIDKDTEKLYYNINIDSSEKQERQLNPTLRVLENSFKA